METICRVRENLLPGLGRLKGDADDGSVIDSLWIGIGVCFVYLKVCQEDMFVF